ncbi:MAG: hypothetical protein ACO1PN_04295 [Betaproteobacteria bacterium]
MKNAKYSARKRAINTWLGIGTWGLGLLIAAIAYLPSDKYGLIEKSPTVLTPLVTWVMINACWIVFTLTLIAAVIKLFRERLDSQWKWSLIQELMNRIAKEAFTGTAGANHHHRATLFQHVQWCWICPYHGRWFWPWGSGRMPWSGWLVPVIRSGYATQKSKTVFLAPDDADKAEGVAGLIWASDKEMVIQTPTAISSTSTTAEVNRYMSDTHVSPGWVQQQIDSGNVLHASFRGIPIEVKGQKWGVLLLDSRDPAAAGNATLHMTNHAFLLGKLIEGETM